MKPVRFKKKIRKPMNRQPSSEAIGPNPTEPPLKRCDQWQSFFFGVRSSFFAATRIDQQLRHACVGVCVCLCVCERVCGGERGQRGGAGGLGGWFSLSFTRSAKRRLPANNWSSGRPAMETQPAEDIINLGRPRTGGGTAHRKKKRKKKNTRGKKINKNI